MDPEVGKAIYSLILSLMIMLFISFAYLNPNELSFYVAIVAMLFLISLLVWTIRDIRKNS